MKNLKLKPEVLKVQVNHILTALFQIPCSGVKRQKYKNCVTHCPNTYRADCMWSIYLCVSSSAGQVSPSSVGCIHSAPPAPAGWARWAPAWMEQFHSAGQLMEGAHPTLQGGTVIRGLCPSRDTVFPQSDYSYIMYGSKGYLGFWNVHKVKNQFFLLITAGHSDLSHEEINWQIWREKILPAMFSPLTSSSISAFSFKIWQMTFEGLHRLVPS